MIAGQVFPVVGVPNQSGTAAVMAREQWMRPASTLHVPGERPKTSLITTTTVSYFCAGYAHGVNAAYELSDNADFAVLDRLTESALDRLAYDAEVRCATKLFTGAGSSYAAPVALTVQSGGIGNSCPTSYFNTALGIMRGNTGLRPNLVVCPQVTYNVLLTHPDIRANGIGETANERLASCFQVTPDQLLVPYLRSLSNQDGQPNPFSDVWSSTIIFLHVNPAGPNVATGTSCFRWRGPGHHFADGPPQTQAWLYRNDENGSSTVFARYYQQEAVLLPELVLLHTTGI